MSLFLGCPCPLSVLKSGVVSENFTLVFWGVYVFH